MKEVDNMEDLVQLDLEGFNKYLGVEAGRQLHTFINHSLLARKKEKDSADNQVTETSTAATSHNQATAPNVDDPFEPIELGESSD